MNPAKNINKLNTIRWKAVIAASIGAFLLAATIVFIQDKLLLTRITDYSKLQTNIINDKYLNEFERKLNATLIKLQTEAETISEYTTQNKAYAKTITQEMAVTFLENDPSMKSVFIISEPYIFDNSDSLLVNTNPGFPIGWYAKYIRHENQGTPELSNDLQTSSNEIYDLYRIIKHDKTPKVVSRHTNADLSNVIVCLMPFYTKNKFSGIIGLDIDQKYYRNILDNQIPASKTIYIADSTGNIFYSRNKDYQNRNIHEVLRFTEEKYGIMSKTAENLPIDIECDLVESNMDKVYIHTKRIALACNNDNFTMISITPSDDIKSEQQKSVVEAIICVLVVLIIFIILMVVISKQLTKPINIVKRMIGKLCEGNFNVENDAKIHNKDMPIEWKKLIESIFTLSKSLKSTASFANNLCDNVLDAKYDDSVKSNTIGAALVTLSDNMRATNEKEKKRFDEERQTQWATEGHSIFSDILRNNGSDIHMLTNAVIDKLVPYINVTQGGIFIRTTMPDDPKTECFELYAVYAYGHQRFHKRTLLTDEGMIGACAMEKHTIIINDIPDNYTDISSGLGQAKPNAIMFVPLIYNDNLYGVMEFATFSKFEKYQIMFVERISENIASTIANTKINEQTALLLQQSRQQSKMMEEKEGQLKGEIESLNNLINITQSELNELEQVNNAMNKTMLVAIFSTKGDTLEANRRFALRYTLDVNDIRRKNVYEILQLTLAKYDEFKKVWDNVKQGSTETYTIEFKINKDTRKIKNVFVPIFNSDNNVERILCLATDVTGQQNTEDELMRVKSQIKELNTEYNNLKKTIAAKDMELATINNELVETKQNFADSRTKVEKANTSAQFYKKELEKRISKSRKIEATLKEKVKAKEEEINRLKQLIEGNITDIPNTDPDLQN